MASIETRQLKNGERHWVRWREGGRRNDPPQGEYFDDLAKAEDFQKLVNLHGQHWPPCWMPRVGQLTPEQYAEAMAAGPADKRDSVMFVPYAHHVINSLTKVNPATRQRYHAHVDNHMAWAFGEVDLAAATKLTARDINRWVLQLGGERLVEPDSEALRGLQHLSVVPLDAAPERPPLAWGTVNNVLQVMFPIMNSAVQDNLIPENPCKGTETPEEQEPFEMAFLEKGEFDFLVTCVPGAILDETKTLGRTGARFGEVTALQVGDLEWGPHRETVTGLRIEHTWKRLPGEGMVRGRPKSKTSVRRLSAAPDVAEILARHAHGKQKDELLFLSPTGRPWEHSNYWIHWKKGTYRAVRCDRHIAQDRERGVRTYELDSQDIVPCGCDGTLRVVPRIHDLRHSLAGWLIAANISLVAIQRWLGHADITTTVSRYGHLVREVDESILKALTW